VIIGELSCLFSFLSATHYLSILRVVARSFYTIWIRPICVLSCNMINLMSLLVFEEKSDLKSYPTKQLHYLF
jgi:hypothetical protein